MTDEMTNPAPAADADEMLENDALAPEGAGAADGTDPDDVCAQSFTVSADRTAASLSSRGVEAVEVARVAAQAAWEKKAEDICVLDLTELSDVCDFFVIATGANKRLADSVIDEIEEKVAAACGEHPFAIEGREEGTWILMDYGSVIVHVFTPEARDYYRLETLWGDAPTLDLQLD